MEKICEFCKALRPVVYCKADGAYLCLSCDAKIHSANALSNQHARSFLCNSCRYLPANLHCLDHKMLICCGCDQSLHDVSSQHWKEAVGSFTGCPLATDFAALWGFDLSNMDNSIVQNQSTSSSCVDSRMVNLAVSGWPCQKIRRTLCTSKVNIETSLSGVESKGGSSNRESKGEGGKADEVDASYCFTSDILHQTLYKGQQQQNAYFILKQILDLERLQLNEGNKHPPLICRREQMDMASPTSNSLKELDEYPYQHLQLTENLDTVDQQKESLLWGLKTNTFPLPLNQSDHSPSCSTAGNSLHGESFGHCKSPVQSSQLWPQSMEDHEFCEEVFHDDFNIPDVDLTFQNYEELFGGDMDPFSTKEDDKEVSCSLIEEDKSLNKSSIADTGQQEVACTGKLLLQMKSLLLCEVAICLYMQVDCMMQNGRSRKKSHCRKCFEKSLPNSALLFDFVTMSVTLSRLSAESSRTDCFHGRFSPNTTVGEASNISSELEGIHLETNEDSVIKNSDKKARLHEKKSTKRKQIERGCCAEQLGLVVICQKVNHISYDRKIVANVSNICIIMM